MFLAFTLCTVSFCFYSVSTKLNCLNCIVVNTPKELFEQSIPLVYVDGNKLYFDQDKLYSKLKKYYDVAVKQYVDEYTLKLYFYNQDDRSLCVVKQCDCVQYSLDCELPFNVKFHRTMFWEIREGATYGE